MEKIFEIASKISTPLALSGIALIILFYIFRGILKKVPVVKQSDGSVILSKVIRVLFVIAVICIILGFMGYVVQLVVNRYYPQLQSEQVDVGTDKDIALEDIVQIVAQQQNVTIYFNPGCDSAVHRALIEPGEHYGKNTMDFLLKLKDRAKGAGINYDVQQKNQNRYEIICN